MGIIRPIGNTGSSTPNQQQWPPIPTWQISDLQKLKQQGLLSGVDPVILAAIDQAESGGEMRGAGINAEGYGGYYGLAMGVPYDAGTASKQMLDTNSQQSFEQQSVIAGSAVAALLQQYNGNLNAAINTYVTGKPNPSTTPLDTTLVDQYYGGSSAAVPSANQIASSTSGISGPAPSSTVGKFLLGLDKFLNPQVGSTAVLGSLTNTLDTLVSRGIMSLFSAGIIFAGIYLMVKQPMGGSGMVDGGIGLSREVRQWQGLSQRRESENTRTNLAQQRIQQAQDRAAQQERLQEQRLQTQRDLSQSRQAHQAAMQAEQIKRRRAEQAARTRENNLRRKEREANRAARTKAGTTTKIPVIEI
jgi:hypothetical protein